MTNITAPFRRRRPPGVLVKVYLQPAEADWLAAESERTRLPKGEIVAQLIPTEKKPAQPREV